MSEQTSAQEERVAKAIQAAHNDGNGSGWGYDCAFDDAIARDAARAALSVLPPSDAERKLAAVLDLHKPVDIEPSETICGECSHALPDGTYEPMVDWPCPTIALLDSEATS